jgi:hypothetical protein
MLSRSLLLTQGCHRAFVYLNTILKHADDYATAFTIQ